MKKIEKIPNPKDFTLAPPPPRILNKQKSYANMIIYIFTLSLEIRKNLFFDNLADYGHLQTSTMNEQCVSAFQFCENCFWNYRNNASMGS